MADQLGSQDYTFTATNLPFLTANASNGLIISKATILNTDTTNRKFSITRNAAGMTTLIITGTGAGATGVIAPSVTQTLPLSGFVLTNGSTLSGLASAASVLNISISYVIPG